jgi:arylsulfatase A-like enzyme
MEVPPLRLPGGRKRFGRLMRRIERAAPARRPRIGERWLPAVLSGAGYETVLLSNNPVVSRQTGMDHGFRHVEDVSFSDLFKPPRVVRRFPPIEHSLRAADYTTRVFRSRQDLRARDAVERVRAWASNRDGARPAFLFVNLMEAHFPYFTPSARRAVREARAGVWTTYRAMRLIEVGRSFLYNMGMLERSRYDRALAALRSLHRYAAAYLDARVGEIVAAVRSGGDRGTVVAVTSDHGDAFGEHDAVFHGITLDEPIMHVPLVVSGDGISASSTTGTVELRQVYATLLEAAGARVPDGAAPSLLSSGATGRPVVAERDRSDVPSEVPPGSEAAERLGRLRAVYTDPYKLVVSEERTRLYDLSTDPAEATDLAPARPEVVAELGAALPPWPEAPEPQDEGEEPAALSAEEQEEIAQQLAALGYLE